MKRFLKLYAIEQKVAFRSLDYFVFAVIMPIGILLFICTIGGSNRNKCRIYIFR